MFGYELFEGYEEGGVEGQEAVDWGWAGKGGGMGLDWLWVVGLGFEGGLLGWFRD